LEKYTGFDNEKYLDEQTSFILERVNDSKNKLYLEFGGKLMFDHHAERVLPGYDPNVKLRLLKKLKDQAEVILCIYAGDIEKRKIRGDFGITYEADAFNLIDNFRSHGISISSVVITRFEDKPAVLKFEKQLKRKSIDVYRHYYTKGYPSDVDLIVSEEGYGKNDYIPTTMPLVVVTGPGPGSGKLATCLSQLYHDHKNGIEAAYSKFETFPIWNIPLKHPVNGAYEAATADLLDYNLVDPFHLETYGEVCINYNRDVDAFPLVKRILEKISGEESPYASPTDMGVNRAGFGIIDDEIVRKAAKQEIVRRYFRYNCEYVLGLAEQSTVNRINLLLGEYGLTPLDRPVVPAARNKALSESEKSDKYSDGKAGALMLRDGTIVTGRGSNIMHAPAAAVLNAVKRLAGIPRKKHILATSTIEAIRTMKKVTGYADLYLDLEEILIALSVCAAAGEDAAKTMGMLHLLKGCELHLSHMPSQGDEAGLRKLGINTTSEPVFSNTV